MFGDLAKLKQLLLILRNLSMTLDTMQFTTTSLKLRKLDLQINRTPA